MRNRRFGLEFVTPEELQTCRQDPAWEARRGIADCTICRKCGAMAKYPLGGKNGHLRRRHQMSVRDYQLRYPGGVRLTSFNMTAKSHGLPVVQKMAESAAAYVTPQELRECRDDPAWENHQSIADYVVCRECGAKLRSAAGGGARHLGRMHGLTRESYLEKYPRAPWSA